MTDFLKSAIIPVILDPVLLHDSYGIWDCQTYPLWSNMPDFGYKVKAGHRSGYFPFRGQLSRRGLAKQRGYFVPKSVGVQVPNYLVNARPCRLEAKILGWFAGPA